MLFWWQWIIIGVFLDSIALSDLLLKKMTQALWENISQNSVLPKNVMFCQFCPPKLVKKEVVGVRLIIDTKKGKQLKHDWEDIQTTSNELLRSEKGEWGMGIGEGGYHHDRLICWSRWSIDLRWMIDHWCYIHPLVILFRSDPVGESLNVGGPKIKLPLFSSYGIFSRFTRN